MTSRAISYSMFLSSKLLPLSLLSLFFSSKKLWILSCVYPHSFPMKVKNGDATNGGQTEDISVYEYFTRHCGIELTESAYLPCLIVGRPKKPNYLPVEVCEFRIFDNLFIEEHFFNLIFWFCFSFLFFSNCVSAVFSCFASTVYKSVILSAEGIFGWEVTAKASGENENCSWCKFYYHLNV